MACKMRKFSELNVSTGILWQILTNSTTDDREKKPLDKIVECQKERTRSWRTCFVKCVWLNAETASSWLAFANELTEMKSFKTQFLQFSRSLSLFIVVVVAVVVVVVDSVNSRRRAELHRTVSFIWSKTIISIRLRPEYDERTNTNCSAFSLFVRLCLCLFGANWSKRIDWTELRPTKHNVNGRNKRGKKKQKQNTWPITIKLNKISELILISWNAFIAIGWVFKSANMRMHWLYLRTRRKSRAQFVWAIICCMHFVRRCSFSWGLVRFNW